MGHGGGYGLREVRQERSGKYSVTEPRPPSTPRPSPSWTPPFNLGDRVNHRTFGIGVVIACNPIKDDAEVTVAFPGVTGVKKLVQKLARLEKI